MPMIDNNVSVIKKWLDQGGDLSKLLAGYNGGSFKELKDKVDLLDDGININVDTELSETSENPVQNKVIKKYIDENTAIKVDANNNTVGGDQESNKINESGILNSLEGKNNSIGISMIPSIKGSIYETNTIIVNEYNGLYISPIRFDDFVYYNKIVNNNGVYTYTVYQTSPKMITDNRGNHTNANDNINYDNIVKIEFYNGKILFEFEFTDTEKYDFIISNGESFSFSKGEIILVPDTAMFTGMVDGVNFSYANGYQNTALSSSVHITGDSNIVGARAYQILESNKSESTYTLDSVIGLQTGDIYSIRLSANYDNWGKITDIYPETNTVKVDTFIDKAVTASSSFRIESKPWLGTTNWASYARSSGVSNRVHGDAASADGRSNIITGRYGRASGYLNKTGYAGHVQNRGNTALGIDASGSGRDTVADGERSFTMGHGTVAKAKDQLARGKYNIPDDGQNYADIVGNGKDDNNRSNAYTLDWDGNAWYAGNIEAKDVFVEKCNTGLNIHGKVEIEKSGTIYSPSAITDILIDNKSILKETVEIQPLYAAKNYADTLCIKDIIVQEHGVRRVVLGEHIKKDSSWVYSSVSSTDTCNYFYIELQTAKDNNNVPILTEEEVSLLPTFIKKDDAKCFWSVNNNGFEELLQTTKKMEIDGSFYIDQTDRLKIWFASMVGEDYSNITTVDDMRKVPIELYLVLENPVLEKLDDKFIEVWDNFNKYYTSNSNIEILYQNSKGVISSLSYSIDHSISSAIDSLTRRINTLDTLTAIKTWEDVRNAVRLGFGATLFPVGYEFTMKDSVTGADITWVVRGHDNHIAANRKFTHTMTLETKYVYSLASGTYRSFVFDATEALYYVAEELPAGTYNFTLPEGYDDKYGGGKTLSFTLTKPIPAGGVIMFPWDDQIQSTDIKISTYASNAATEAIESVAVRESLDGTSLGVADGTEENLNHAHRIRYGSNNYAQSAVRQWLNSDAAAGGVWAPTTIFDRPPSWNTSYSGFMRGLPAAFLAVVQPVDIPCRTNSIFEVNSLDGTKFDINQVYTLRDKFFLLSRPEIYGTWDSETYKDGTLLDFYYALANSERIKYDATGLARICWLRSPHPGYAYSERSVRDKGALNYNRTRYAYGVAPACIIA